MKIKVEVDGRGFLDESRMIAAEECTPPPPKGQPE
jgi:hypothetical protein